MYYLADLNTGKPLKKDDEIATNFKEVKLFKTKEDAYKFANINRIAPFTVQPVRKLIKLKAKNYKQIPLIG